MQFSQRPISAISAKTDFAKAPRPFSAASRKSTIQTSPKKVSYKEKIDGVIRQGRGLGFFGDDDDKIKQAR